MNNGANFPGLSAAATWRVPYDPEHDRHQDYYVTGLRAVLAEQGVDLDARSLQRFPRTLRALRRIRHSHRLSGLMGWTGPLLDAVAGVLGGRRVPPSGRLHPLAGQYVFSFRDGRSVRLVVDAHDAGEIVDDQLLHRCDVYAKSNYRRDRSYPPHVVPVVNANPLVLPHLPLLRQLRQREPVYDCCFVVRVWGGRDEVSGVEHNLRILEALNRARCSKFLLAYLVTGDVTTQERRLRSQGIPTARQPMSLRELWEVAAASRLNLIRLGMHNCIPWRFMDMLAMGACVVLDQAPQTVWPTPLIPGEHFLALGVTTPPGGGAASEEDYERIPEQVDRFVADREAVRRVRNAAASYYDQSCSPGVVGRYLLDRVCGAGSAAS